jgi:hypothetical protein
LADFLNKLQTNPYMPAFGVEQLPSAMHIVPSGAPTRRILSGGWDNTTHSIVTGSHPDLDAQMTAVPVPDSFYAAHDGALEDDGAGGKTIGDCVYSIYQPSTDTIWEFWGAAKNGTTFDSTGRLVDQWVIPMGYNVRRENGQSQSEPRLLYSGLLRRERCGATDSCGLYDDR